MEIFLLTLAAVLAAVGLVALGVFAKFSFGGWSVELPSHLSRWQRGGVGLCSFAGASILILLVTLGSRGNGDKEDNKPGESPTNAPQARLTPNLPSGSTCDPAEITLSVGTARRGSEVTVHGSCFEPGERVEIRVHTTVVGSATADSEGGFMQTIVVPEAAPPPGFPTSIAATGQSSIKTATAPFTTAR